jgi:hypothetical protein
VRALCDAVDLREVAHAIDAHGEELRAFLRAPHVQFVRACRAHAVPWMELRAYVDADALPFATSAIVRVDVVLAYVRRHRARTRAACALAAHELQRLEASPEGASCWHAMHVQPMRELHAAPKGRFAITGFPVACPAAEHVHGLDGVGVCAVAHAGPFEAASVAVRLAELVHVLVDCGLFAPQTATGHTFAPSLARVRGAHRMRAALKGADDPGAI